MLFAGFRVYELGLSRAERKSRTQKLALSFVGGVCMSLAAAVLLGAKAAAVFGPFFVLAYLIFGNFATLAPVDQVRWEPARSMRGVALGFLIGAAIGLVDGLRAGHGNMQVLASYGLGFGFSVAIFGAMAMGLSPRLVTARILPNEGVHRSLRRAAMYGIASTTLGIAAFGLSFHLLSADKVSFGASVRLATVLGMGAAILGGGLYVIEHFTARLIFVLTGQAPPNYTRFLNDASQKLLLRRVGSGFQFQHGSLMDHFADSLAMSTRSSPSK
jgi:hypothetical protein